MPVNEPPIAPLTTLLVPVPFAEDAVGASRREHDWAARLGVPAHVTVLGPFLPREEVDTTTLGRLRDVFAASPPIAVTLDAIAPWDGTVCLLATQAAALAALVERLRREWPAFPWRRHHVTVARDCDEALYAEIAARVRPRLPLRGTVSEARLLALGAEGVVEQLGRFPFAAPPERHPSLEERFDPAIRIVEHDPAWATQAEEELERIAAALGPLAVRLHHVGSTAVPGLAAKPILDLQACVSAIDPTAAYVGALERLGYLFAPDPDSRDLHFFGKPAQRPRTHHLHVCEAGSAHEQRHLAVRDFLRAHPGEVARYAALKQELVARHPQDRLAYIDGKEAHVVALERRALAWVASA